MAGATSGTDVRGLDLGVEVRTDGKTGTMISCLKTNLDERDRIDPQIEIEMLRISHAESASLAVTHLLALRSRKWMMDQFSIKCTTAE
jgi:hypothetical protein